ncbi:hypothetical protein [Ferrovibrio xuzhouensis]|uniref:Uncharacterized protein n=1 Tax=Ferrovibrio xuzhouensis TaxID=1576914 RepID=A0ABV7VDW7_9PROT
MSMEKSQASWPGLTRPSTSFSVGPKDVDARHEAGHDGEFLVISQE